MYDSLLILKGHKKESLLHIGFLSFCFAALLAQLLLVRRSQSNRALTAGVLEVLLND